ncbi:cation-translocating P-type ATPase [Peredibacter starrii]|uniref:HAD-IC family P-type ATPase n=1 Tax=Peredibacter starrii TaxID=28202 RepID=A0AAX4HUB3_9BACT|nr:HAD-IC family P-type ATPase [Peredibacter starrii]WPU66571.1 HAD-IC family P-type ATPase [Peredibacter starrii]
MEPSTLLPDHGTSAWHNMNEATLFDAHRSDLKSGLSSEVANQRLKEFGSNELPEPKHRSLFAVFIKQFQSPLIYLLLIAASIAFFLNKISDAAVILTVVMLNSLIGSLQESKAERSLESLRKLAKLMVTVRRDGQEVRIEARELVPGDIFLLNAGDAVGADGRIIEARDLSVAESALTGESLPVRKSISDIPVDTILAERTNMVYSGTFVTSGRGTVIVVATGQNTEVGKIAKLTNEKQNLLTPLENKISHFGRTIIYLAAVVFFLIVGIGILRGLELSEIFMIGVSQIVSMIPEGLPVAITVALAVGVRRMAGKKAIVRKLSAVETLGSTDIICTDKTGTLTKNEMTVEALYLPSGISVDVTGVGYSPSGEFIVKGNSQNETDKDIDQLLTAGVLCNDARLIQDDKNLWKILGDPTEGALLTVAAKRGMHKEEFEKKFPRKDEIPFDSSLKLMATEHQIDGKIITWIKGAPEKILHICGTDERAHLASEKMAQRALRVLAFAKIEGPITEEIREATYNKNIVFLGLVGQMDPPRQEVRAAIEECLNAGIRPVMVTGDHKHTGQAIGKVLGIMKSGDQAIDGAELEMMSDDELEKRINHISVFARVHPDQKLRIIKTFQNKKNVVAMTGDGVNDSPALVRADVGVAMGITGTDTAKESAKIIITDDNFSTIVEAVKQGRLVYRNVKKLIIYFFTTSISELLVLFTAILLGYPPPLAAVQILWINLVTDGALTVTLIMEPEEGDEMKQRPVPREEPLIDRHFLRRMSLLSPTIALTTLGYFFYSLEMGFPFVEVQSQTFTLLAVAQWFNALNCRSDKHSVFRMSLLSNKWLIGGLLTGFLLQALVIYAPFMNKLFYTTPIAFRDVLTIGVIGSLVLWVEEIRKLVLRRKAGPAKILQS